MIGYWRVRIRVFEVVRMESDKDVIFIESCGLFIIIHVDLNDLDQAT
jgi:hypothetical protein